MDGENKGSKPYFQTDDLGFFPLFLVQHPASFKPSDSDSPGSRSWVPQRWKKSHVRQYV